MTQPRSPSFNAFLSEFVMHPRWWSCSAAYNCLCLTKVFVYKVTSKVHVCDWKIVLIHLRVRGSMVNCSVDFNLARVPPPRIIYHAHAAAVAWLVHNVWMPSSGRNISEIHGLASNTYPVFGVVYTNKRIKRSDITFFVVSICVWLHLDWPI